jgi:hypothetical protein
VQVSLTGPWAPYTFASDAGVPAYA